MYVYAAVVPRRAPGIARTSLFAHIPRAHWTDIQSIDTLQTPRLYREAFYTCIRITSS